MQSTHATPADLLAARTARNVSIKTAATEMGIGFTKLLNFNRGKHTTPETNEVISRWVAEQPQSEPEIDGEEWRAVVGWEGLYEVSSFGRVRSAARTVMHSYSGEITVRERHLRQNLDGFHLQVSLAKGGRCYSRRVHLMELEAFVGPRPPRMDGCHNNGISRDNRLTNLRWDTRTENMLDRVWHETNPGVVRPAVAARILEEER